MEIASVPVPSVFVAYVESLMARLGYLYPDVTWSFDSETSKIIVQYDPEAYSYETLVKEASFQLYREKIYHDTLDIRGRIYEAVQR